jgi:hypothetical protein
MVDTDGLDSKAGAAELVREMAPSRSFARAIVRWKRRV